MFTASFGIFLFGLIAAAGGGALAGTDPNNTGSYFQLTGQSLVSETNVVIRWPSESNRSYNIHSRTDLLFGGSVPLLTNLPATPPLNVQTVPVEQADQQFFLIDVQP